MMIFEVFHVVVVSTVVGGLFVAFAREWRPPEVSAAVAVAILLITGVISPEALIATFSNPAPVTIGSLFILSAALVRTGAFDALTVLLTNNAESRPFATYAFMIAGVVVSSAFLNNTPIVLMTIPAAVAMAAHSGCAPSKYLLPVSFASILGGTCTLIGTSTNILVDGVAQANGLAPFSIFEIAPIGIVLALVGGLYLIIAQRLLPDRLSLATLITDRSKAKYVAEFVIGEDSQLIGQNPISNTLLNRNDRSVHDVVRNGVSLRGALTEASLKPGDIVGITLPASELMTLKEQGFLEAGAGAIASRDSALIETLVGPESRLIGKTLRHLRFRRRYGVYPLALHRRGHNVEERFEQLRLAVGDTLLLEGSPKDLQRLADDYSLVDISKPASRGFRRGRAPIAIGALLLVVLGAAFGVMPIAGLAIIAVALILATRCVEADEAFEAVDWRILVFILSMLAIGAAIDRSGLLELIVGGLTPVLKNANPIVALAIIYVIASLLTEIVTNNAVAIVLTPIAIGLADALGADPRPFVVAVMFASSASFLSPIGYQTNTLVYNAGGYRFTDFFRFGWPLNLAAGAVAILGIPLIWPL